LQREQTKAVTDMERKDSLKEKMALTAETLLPRISKFGIAIYLIAILLGVIFSLYPLVSN
jgi:hypothetical protein